MARNKHPEETVAKILDVAMRLFVERGYEQTSMQNIIDELGGLTKGAVYHHFSSKEEIFFAAMDRVMAPGVERLRKIRDAKGMTGREKIQAMFQNGARGVDSAFFSQADPELDPMKNPRMLATEYRDLFDISAHELMLPAIEQGIRDGSIQTEYPRELAETIALLSNLWCVPAFFPARDEEEQRRRVGFMNDFLSAMGLEVVLDPRVSLETWRHRCGGPVQESVQASARADATRDARAGERTQG